MVDSHGTFTVGEAKRFAHLVRDCDLAWFEEPVTCDDKAGIAELAPQRRIPDRLRRKRIHPLRFPRSHHRPRCDILQPDLATCGGITEARRIEALANTSI